MEIEGRYILISLRSYSIFTKSGLKEIEECHNTPLFKLLLNKLTPISLK